MNERIGPTYNDTNEPINAGDLVYFDNQAASVEAVLMPNTPEASNYYCEDTGGLLLTFEKFGLTLEPFGVCNRVVKRKEK